jgi:hypothetical protein
MAGLLVTVPSRCIAVAAECGTIYSRLSIKKQYMMCHPQLAASLLVRCRTKQGLWCATSTLDLYGIPAKPGSVRQRSVCQPG